MRSAENIVGGLVFCASPKLSFTITGGFTPYNWSGSKHVLPCCGDIWPIFKTLRAERISLLNRAEDQSRGMNNPALAVVLIFFYIVDSHPSFVQKLHFSLWCQIPCLDLFFGCVCQDKILWPNFFSKDTKNTPASLGLQGMVLTLFNKWLHDSELVYLDFYWVPWVNVPKSLDNWYF